MACHPCRQGLHQVQLCFPSAWNDERPWEAISEYGLKGYTRNVLIISETLMMELAIYMYVCVYMCVCIYIYIFIFIFIFIFWLHSRACGILLPRPGIEPMPPAVEAQILNHWNTREGPGLTISYKTSGFQVFLAIRVCSGTWLSRTEIHRISPY